jgi:hypothetical protein
MDARNFTELRRLKSSVRESEQFLYDSAIQSEGDLVDLANEAIDNDPMVVLGLGRADDYSQLFNETLVANVDISNKELARLPSVAAASNPSFAFLNDRIDRLTELVREVSELTWVKVAQNGTMTFSAGTDQGTTVGAYRTYAADQLQQFSSNTSESASAPGVAVIAQEVDDGMGGTTSIVTNTDVVSLQSTMVDYTYPALGVIELKAIIYFPGVSEKIATKPVFTPSPTFNVQFRAGLQNHALDPAAGYLGTLPPGAATVKSVRHINVTVNSGENLGFLLDIEVDVTGLSETYPLSDAIFNPPGEAQRTLTRNRRHLKGNAPHQYYYVPGDFRGYVDHSPVLLQLVGDATIAWDALVPPSGFAFATLNVNDALQILILKVAELEFRLDQLESSGGFLGIFLGIVTSLIGAAIPALQGLLSKSMNLAVSWLLDRVSETTAKYLVPAAAFIGERLHGLIGGLANIKLALPGPTFDAQLNTIAYQEFYRLPDLVRASCDVPPEDLLPYAEVWVKRVTVGNEVSNLTGATLLTAAIRSADVVRRSQGSSLRDSLSVYYFVTAELLPYQGIGVSGTAFRRDVYTVLSEGQPTQSVLSGVSGTVSILHTHQYHCGKLGWCWNLTMPDDAGFSVDPALSQSDQAGVIQDTMIPAGRWLPLGQRGSAVEIEGFAAFIEVYRASRGRYDLRLPQCLPVAREVLNFCSKRRLPNWWTVDDFVDQQVLTLRNQGIRSAVPFSNSDLEQIREAVKLRILE